MGKHIFKIKYKLLNIIWTAIVLVDADEPDIHKDYLLYERAKQKVKEAILPEIYICSIDYLGLEEAVVFVD